MTTRVNDQLLQALSDSRGCYHQLTLLVGPPRSGKTTALNELASAVKSTITNVSLAVASDLLELIPRQRSLRIPDLLNEIIETDTSVVLLDNLELLFDITLKQDPLRLLQGISRKKTIVATWQGFATDTKLTYAEIGHPEYRIYDAVDGLIVNSY